MTAPISEASDGELIQLEIAAAKEALDRFHELTVIEHRSQKERMASIEKRLESLEDATENLRQQALAMTQSKIWRTLVWCGKLIAGFSRTVT